MFFHVPNNAIEISLSPALSRPCSSAGIALSMRAVRRFLTSGDESSMPRRNKVVFELFINLYKKLVFVLFVILVFVSFMM